MFKAKCSHEDCEFVIEAKDFDQVADVLTEHHFEEHGVLMDGESPLASEWSDTNAKKGEPQPPEGKKKARK